MNELHAFVSLHRNASPLQVSALGELPVLCRTYSKTQEDYPGSNYTLTVFSSTFNGQQVSVAPPLVNVIFGLTDALTEQMASRPRPYDFPAIEAFITQQSGGTITSLNLYDVVTENGETLPGRITFKYGDTDVAIYYSHETLTGQYPNYDIVVIPPITRIDDFLLPYTQVKDILTTQATITNTIKAVATARGKFPETALVSITVDFDTPEPNRASIPVTWTCLIYGPRGNYSDAIKSAIIQYILANAASTRENWENNIFPSLFKTTEFVILPQWDKTAIPNVNNTRGIYSPTVIVTEVITSSIADTPFYSSTHTARSIEVIPTQYKSLALACVAGVNNVDGKKTIQEQYPDYLPISTDSLDFARMSVNTQQFVVFLETLIIRAEGIHNVEGIEVFYIKRNNILFASGTFNDVNYLVKVRAA